MLIRKTPLIILILIFFCEGVAAQYVTNKEAMEDFTEFKNLMERESSYYHLSDFNFNKAFDDLKKSIQGKDSVLIRFLAVEFGKLIAKTIDRHASIKVDTDKASNTDVGNIYLPLALSSLKGKVVGLKKTNDSGVYGYYFKKYPFLTKIDGMDIAAFLETYIYRSHHSPSQAKLTDGLRYVGKLGELYQKHGHSQKNDVRLTFSNGKKEHTVTLPLSSEPSPWNDPGSLRVNKKYQNFGREANYDLEQLDTWLTDSIGYIAIPAMASYPKNPDLESYFINSTKKYRKAKALIVDVRSNGGGTRHILNTLSGYFVQPAQSPWVANIAYVRSDQRLDEDIASMQGRFLYNYNSNYLTDNDRQAIDMFNNYFKTEHIVNQEKFSQPYYMVLNSNGDPITCPIYILVNEESFSAASVFTSVFKGLPNVKIVGVNTNGSSGRSVRFKLNNSNIQLRISTMLSFQRNGKTLDSQGTVPDIIIEREKNQVMGKKDYQLEALIQLIQNK